MFSKTIFKQTLKSNYGLWLIFTALVSAMSAIFIAIYDPKTMGTMVSTIKDSALGSLVGDRIDGMSTLNGLLANNFYSMVGIILPVVYIIITANSLVASQVDRGSMAYTLSTPIRRTKVIATQALYMIGAIATMFLVVTGVGMTTTQIAHGGVFTTAYTKDVQQISPTLGVSKDDLANDLSQILDHPKAVRKGAKARDVDQDVYTTYLQLKMTDNANKAAADVLAKKVAKVEATPQLILDSKKATKAAAKVMGLSSAEYRVAVQQQMVQAKAAKAQASVLQDKMIKGMAAAAKSMGKKTADMSDHLAEMKDDKNAMAAASQASGLPVPLLTQALDKQLATKLISEDKGGEFDLGKYLTLNLGAFLLLFAMSAISFASSCIFNLTKYSLSFGAGLPLAFMIFHIMAQTGDDLENFKYLSLNTLFDTQAIINNDSVVLNFIVLGVIGVCLYVVGLEWFKRKDLPL
ncbi:ABC-2 transporter permease [Lacticaseibacillus daqingensis]|uniref:ABC transporter permease subunit n=1 Tax=Lacticaseibacillus daqingensis TaxID=2486014 RepID=UPI000F784B2A|nr:ABC transporter permease subunit [Lacticaseibacillus daqingensis]